MTNRPLSGSIAAIITEIKDGTVFTVIDEILHSPLLDWLVGKFNWRYRFCQWAWEHREFDEDTYHIIATGTDQELSNFWIDDMEEISMIYTDTWNRKAVRCHSALYDKIRQKKSFMELQAEAAELGLDPTTMAYATDEQLVYFIGVRRGMIADQAF